MVIERMGLIKCLQNLHFVKAVVYIKRFVERELACLKELQSVYLALTFDSFDLNILTDPFSTPDTRYWYRQATLLIGMAWHGQEIQSPPHQIG